MYLQCVNLLATYQVGAMPIKVDVSNNENVVAYGYVTIQARTGFLKLELH